MPKQYLKVVGIVLGLAVLIVVVSYLVSQNKAKLAPVSKNSTQTQQTGSTPAPAGTSAQAAANQKMPQPPATTSGEPVEKFVAEVRSAAQSSNTLEVTNCQANPAVLKAQKGQKLTVKNNDSQDVTLRIAAGAIYTVAANKSDTFTINIEPAIYTYACDRKGGSTVGRAGVMEVTP